MKGGSKPPQTSEEAVQRVLTHIERQAGRADSSAAFDGLLRVPDLPLDALTELGPLTRLGDAGNADALPSLLLETSTGQVQIELCPFGPLALLTSNGEADTDPLALALYAAEIFPLFPPTWTAPAPGTATPSPAGFSPHASPTPLPCLRHCADKKSSLEINHCGCIINGDAFQVALVQGKRQWL